MVGAVRFELTTSCTRNKRASQATLRPEPKCGRNMRNVADDCNGFLSYGPKIYRERREREAKGQRPHALGCLAFNLGRPDGPSRDPPERPRAMSPPPGNSGAAECRRCR